MNLTLSELLQNYLTFPEYLLKRNILNKFMFMDIGAAGEIFEIFASFENTNSTIIGIEPLPWEFEKLNNVIKPTKPIHQQYYNVALGKAENNKEFYVSNNNVGSSFNKNPDSKFFERFKNFNENEIREILKLDIIPLDNFCLQNEINYIDFIKIDVEGNEVDVLDSGKIILKDVLCIFTEVFFQRMNKNFNTFFEIDQFLTSNGFLLWDLSTDGKWIRKDYNKDCVGQLIVGNALYLRDFINEPIKKNSDSYLNKILKTCIFAQCFQHKDYALELINFIKKNNLLKP